MSVVVVAEYIIAFGRFPIEWGSSFGSIIVIVGEVDRKYNKSLQCIMGNE